MNKWSLNKRWPLFLNNTISPLRISPYLHFNIGFSRFCPVVFLTLLFTGSLHGETQGNAFVRAESLWMGWNNGNAQILLQNYADPAGSQLLGQTATQDLTLGAKAGLRMTFEQWPTERQGSRLSFYLPPTWKERTELNNINIAVSPAMIGVSSLQLLLPNTMTITTEAERNLIHFHGDLLQASGTGNRRFSLGFHYLRLQDNLTLAANGTDFDGNANRTDITRVRTNNESMGIAGAVSRQFDIYTMTLALGANGGLLINRTRQRMNEDSNAEQAGVVAGNLIQYSGEQFSLSTLVGFNARLTMPVRSYLSVQLGADWMRLDGLALAADQLALLGEAANFTTPVQDNRAGTSHGGEVTLYGAFLGIEINW